MEDPADHRRPSGREPPIISLMMAVALLTLLGWCVLGNTMAPAIHNLRALLSSLEMYLPPGQ